MNNKPCIRCGSTERYKSGDCRVCARRRALQYQVGHREERNAYKRQWRREDYAKNPQKYKLKKRAWRAKNRERENQRTARWYAEHGREYHRAWRAQNREARRESHGRWLKTHRETARVASRRWRLNNPAKVRAQQQRRRAHRKGAQGTHTAHNCEQRSAYYGHICWVCCETQTEAMDHIIALCNGGSDWPANLRPICARCNGAKGAWESTGHKTAKQIINWAHSYREAKAIPSRLF